MNTGQTAFILTNGRETVQSGNFFPPDFTIPSFHKVYDKKKGEDFIIACCTTESSCDTREWKKTLDGRSFDEWNKAVRDSNHGKNPYLRSPLFKEGKAIVDKETALHRYLKAFPANEDSPYFNPNLRMKTFVEDDREKAMQEEMDNFEASSNLQQYISKISTDDVRAFAMLLDIPVNHGERAIPINEIKYNLLKSAQLGAGRLNDMIDVYEDDYFDYKIEVAKAIDSGHVKIDRRGRTIDIVGGESFSYNSLVTNPVAYAIRKIVDENRETLLPQVYNAMGKNMTNSVAEKTSEYLDQMKKSIPVDILIDTAKSKGIISYKGRRILDKDENPITSKGGDTFASYGEYAEYLDQEKNHNERQELWSVLVKEHGCRYEDYGIEG